MSGSVGGPPSGPRHLADAVLRRRRFPLLWLVPIGAVLLSLYLGVTYLGNRGPLIKITLSTADGITAQQTELKYKAVTLGMVEDVRLSEDMKHAAVHVRMNSEGARVLTDHARFWVVRPRLTPGNISGLETLVSGAYIGVDPGAPGGTPKYDFTGLEEPPGVRSDEPGKTYRLLAARLGTLGPGSPVFYRDVTVGEVLGYDLGDGIRPVTIDAFVKAPFDKYVHDNTHFFNSSGISLTVGPGGLHVELQSLQALISGGVTFETPRFLAAEPPSDASHTFKLFENQTEADAAGFARNIPFVTYFTSSVSGLGRGSAVEVFGLQIGAVTDVRLVMDPAAGKMRARVAFNLQPERVFTEAQVAAQPDPERVTNALVQAGMRAVLNSSNFITGQKDISLQYVPGAAPAALGHEGDALVLPSQGGGLDNITASISDITSKLDKIPFDEIGRNLADTLKSVDRTVSGPDVQNALHRLADTLADVQQLVRHADAGMTPVLKRLPQISADLQAAVAHANALLGQEGYGGNSDFQRNVDRLLDQVNNTARSIRLLADFLDRHPEALLTGRTAHATER
jgi:paraquat-inducible protein B